MKVFKYKGNKYMVSEVDFKKTKSFIVRHHGLNGLFINKNLGESEKQREIHRLIKSRGMRNIG